MCKQLFKGEDVSLMEMLDAREARSHRQTTLFQQFPKKTLLSMTLNVPGPVKRSDQLESIFLDFVKLVQVQVGQEALLFEKVFLLKTGPEYYAVIDLPAEQVKRLMMQLETEQLLGRLFDLDVLFMEEEQIKSISRQDLGFPARRCYVCQEDAKACGRSRKHDLASMQAAIVALVEQVNQ